MAHCSIVNSSVEAVLETSGINIDRFVSFIDSISDIVDPFRKSKFNIFDITDTEVLKQVLPKINKFLKHPSHIGFLAFIKENYSSTLRKIYDIQTERTGSQWQSYVEAVNYLSDKWNKFVKERTRSDGNAKMNMRNADGLFESQDEVSLEEYIDNTEIELTSILGDKNVLDKIDDNGKVVFRELFGINLDNVDFNADEKSFKSQLDLEIKRVNDAAKHNDSIRAISKLYKEYKTAKEAYKSASTPKEKERFKTLICNTVSQLAKYRRQVVLMAMAHSRINATQGSVLSLAKEKILQSYYKQNHTNTQDGLGTMFFPCLQKNYITDKQWDAFSKKVEESENIGNLLEKYSSNLDANNPFCSFLKSLSECDCNPKVEIITIERAVLSAGALKDSIENFKKANNVNPFAVYLTKTKAKSLGYDSDMIIILDQGKGKRNMSLSGLTHEWLHGLTAYSLVNNANGFNQTVEILRNHALKAFKEGKVDMSGIDTNKLNMVNGIPYALTGTAELIAEAFNNQEVQRMLDRINSPFEHKNKKSLWEWLLDNIKKLISDILERVGHKRGVDTVLSELLISGSTTMQFSVDNQQTANIDDVINDGKYGTYLSPTVLPKATDDITDILNEVPLSPIETELISSCNNIVTPTIADTIMFDGELQTVESQYGFERLIQLYNKDKSKKEHINKVSYNMDTVAVLYVNDDIYDDSYNMSETSAKERANMAINGTVSAARKILNMGGRCLTVGKTHIDNNAMSNVANAKIYQALIDEGYKPYENGNITVWVKEQMTEEEKKEFLLDAATIKKLTPTVKVEKGRTIINPTPSILAQLTQGVTTLSISKNDELYDSLKVSSKGDVRIYGDNMMYYGTINAISMDASGTLSLSVSLKTTEYNAFDTGSIDFEGFYSEDILLPNDDDIEAKLGVQKTEWRKNMIARELIQSIRKELLRIKPEEYGYYGKENDNDKIRLQILWTQKSFNDIVSDLRKKYEDYISGTDEYRIRQEFKRLTVERYEFDYEEDDDTLHERAEGVMPKRLAAFEEMMPYFDDLVKLARKQVGKAIGSEFIYYSDLIEDDSDDEASYNDETNETDDSNNDESGVNSDEQQSDDKASEDETIGKDHWVESSSNKNIHDTVNAKIKEILAGVNKSFSDGYMMRDDIDNILYEDEQDVFSELLNIVKGSRNIEEMKQKILDYASHGHFDYGQIYGAIDGNSELESLFFNGLCSQRKEIESVVVIDDNTFVKHNNKDAKEDWFVSAATFSIDGKQVGTVNSLDGSAIAAKLYNELLTAKVDEGKEMTVDDAKKLQGYLQEIGISLSADDILRSIYENTKAYNDAIDAICDIAKYCTKNKNDIASTSNYYKKLAKILNDSIPVVQESRTYCEGKTYPSFNHPSYISRMIDALANTNLKERRLFMDKEFKRFTQYYTKNNLDEMIEVCKTLASTNERYLILAEWLDSLHKVEEISGDREVGMRIAHAADVASGDFAELLNNIPAFREGRWNYTWLEQLYLYEKTKISISDMLSYDGIKYTREGEEKLLKTMFLKFRQGKPAFSVPIYADANCWNFISFKKQGIERILDGFERIMLSEIDRVKQVRERHEQRLKAFEEFNARIKSEPNLSLGDIEGYTYPIPNWDIETKVVYKKNGSIDIEKSSVVKNANALQYMYYKYDPASNLSMKEQIKTQMEEGFFAFKSYVADVIQGNIPQDSELYEFYMEHCFATANILAITSSPVFYKNAIDFQKRYKEVYAMTSRLNVNAEGGRKWEYSITIKDSIVNEFKNAAYKEIGDAIKRVLKQSKHLTTGTKKYIQSKLSEINVADAQCFRTPSSYAAIIKMLGLWNDSVETAWNNIKAKKNTISNFQTILGVLKPFLRSNYVVPSKTSYGDIKVPVQRKNSEFMSIYGSGMNMTNIENPILRALTDFMEKYHIDSANFESAVKTGNQAPIDLSGCKTYQDTIEMLYKATGISENLDTAKLRKDIANATDNPVIIGNPEVVKITPFEDYGIVAPNPEHFVNKKVKISNQFRRVMRSNINFADTYEIEEVSYERVKDGQRYDRAKDKMVDNYVTKKIVTKKKVNGRSLYDRYNRLIKDNLSESYKGIEELLSNNDKMAAFLSEKVMNDDLASPDLKECIKRNKYGNFTNITDPINSPDIHRILMSKFRNTITQQKAAGGTCVQVSTVWSDDVSLHFKEDSDGNTVIDYAECYLPCYMKELYSFAIDDNGALSLDKLRELYEEIGDLETYDKLISMVGYRTPCEGVSSCIPLRIKGFLPATSGSCVILPKEITYLSGSDFDVDKLYIIRHDFYVDKRGIPRIIKGDSVRGRNNQWLDLLLQLFSTRQYTEQFLDGSNFDELKKSVNILNIIRSGKALPMSIEDLKKLSPDDVEEIAKDYPGEKVNYNLLAPETRAIFYTQNFTGKELLSVWAVYKSAADLLQYCGLEVNPDYTITLNGRKYKKLCPTTIKDGQTAKYLTKNIGQYLAAAADNTKDPVLYKLGITKDNVNTVAYLAMMGLDSTSIALIINAANMYIGDGNFDKKALAPYLSSLTDDKLARPDERTAECAAYILSKAKKAGEDLQMIMTPLRADSQNGALKKDIYSTISFKQKIDEAFRIINNGSVFVNTSLEPIIDKASVISSSFQSNTQIQFVQQFYDYGIRAYFEKTKDLFAEFNETFEDAFTLSRISRNRYLQPKTVKDVMQHLYYYHVLSLPFFGEATINGKHYTSKERIDNYKNKMPQYFQKVMTEHPELYENDFLKRLQIKSVDSIDTIVLPNAFQYKGAKLTEIRCALNDLFLNDDMEIRQFAWELLRYSFYRQGFGRKRDGYGHLFAKRYYNAIPGYKQLMRSLQSGSVSNGSFKWQFLSKYTNMTNEIERVSKDELKAMIGDATPTIDDIAALMQKKYGEHYPEYVMYRKKVYNIKKYIETGVKEAFRPSRENSFINYNVTPYNINLETEKVGTGNLDDSLIDTHNANREDGYFEEKRKNRSDDPESVC